MNIEIAKKWLKQALHDLEIAEGNLSIKGYDTAAFLSHQAVEKLFKALLAFEAGKIPRTHHIDELARDLNLPSEVCANVIDLTVDYIFARYPDAGEIVPFEEYSIGISSEKVGKAKSIFAFLKDRYAKILEGKNE